MSTLLEVLVYVVYYGKDNMWKVVQMYCEKFLSGYGDEPAAQFLRGVHVAIMKDGELVSLSLWISACKH